MVHLMEKDVKKRLTAKEALQHPWLKEKKKMANKDPKAPSKDANGDDEQKAADLDVFAVEELANFATGKDFKYAVTALFREQYKNMRPRHFEELSKQFAALDADGDGKISYKDFEHGMLQISGLALDKKTIKQIFDGLDANKIGQIEFGDMLNAAVHDYLVQSDARLYEAFRDLDKNDEGKIGTAQLKAKIKEMNPYGNDNVEMLLRVIDDVDLDNDGTIDYEEFLHALHPDFQETPNWFWSDDKYKPRRKGSNNDDGKEQDDEEDDDDDADVDPAPVDQQEVQSQRSVKGQDDATGKELHIVKEGWMYKQGGFVKTWRNRWFELQNNGIISYYHNPNEDYPIARFNCLHFTELKNKSWGKSAQKKFGIKMYTPHRDWKFLCKDEEERKAWVQKFREVREENMDKK